MRGRKRYRPTRIIVIILVFCVVGLSVGSGMYWSAKKIITYTKNFTSSVAAINVIEFSFDKIYSLELRQSITHYLEKKIIGTNLLSFSSEAFYSDVKEVFAVVKNIVCRQITPSSVHVHVEGFQPAYCINKDRVAGSDGLLMNKKYYSEFALDTLPHIAVIPLKASAQVLEEDVQKFLSNLNVAWLDNFICEYRSCNEVLFTAHDMRQVHGFVMTADQARENLDISIIPLIVNDLREKKQLASWQSLEFDFRFNNRIITKKTRTSRRGRVKK